VYVTGVDINSLNKELSRSRSKELSPTLATDAYTSFSTIMQDLILALETKELSTLFPHHFGTEPH
jgi:hypothetical protein